LGDETETLANTCPEFKRGQFVAACLACSSLTRTVYLVYRELWYPL